MGKILGTYLMPHPPILIPQIGRGEEKRAEQTIKACQLIGEEIHSIGPDVIIIITPHGPVFRDAVAITRVNFLTGDFSKFGLGDLKIEKNLNLEITDEIISNGQELQIPIVQINENSRRDYNIKCELDHGSMVPLYFIDKFYKNYKLVHITYGILSPVDLYKFGTAIKRAVYDLAFNAIVIASGDLSHRLSDSGPYEYNVNGPLFDKTIIELLEQGSVKDIFSLDNTMIEAAGECGLRSIYTMLGTMDGCGIRGQKLSYEGPFGVGYGVLRLLNEPKESGFSLTEYIKELNAEALKNRNESDEVRLARESLMYYLNNRKYMDIPDYISGTMKDNKSGVFVSMKKHGKLRGCVGTIMPCTDSIASEIVRNAVEAAEHDMRFPPVTADEINEITFSVDVLTTPVKAVREELDPVRYGVIVSYRGRRGLLLPALEGVDTVEEQLSIALKKAGIQENSDYSIEKFEVIRYR